MSATLGISLVVGTIVILLMALVAIGWLITTFLLLGILGWHPPGWLISPGAHILNTSFAGIIEVILACVGVLSAMAAILAMIE